MMPGTPSTDISGAKAPASLKHVDDLNACQPGFVLYLRGKSPGLIEAIALRAYSLPHPEYLRGKSPGLIEAGRLKQLCLLPAAYLRGKSPGLIEAGSAGHEPLPMP